MRAIKRWRQETHKSCYLFRIIRMQIQVTQSAATLEGRRVHKSAVWFECKWPTPTTVLVESISRFSCSCYDTFNGARSCKSWLMVTLLFLAACLHSLMNACLRKYQTLLQVHLLIDCTASEFLRCCQRLFLAHSRVTRTFQVVACYRS